MRLRPDAVRHTRSQTSGSHYEMDGPQRLQGDETLRGHRGRAEEGEHGKIQHRLTVPPRGIIQSEV